MKALVLILICSIMAQATLTADQTTYRTEEARIEAHSAAVRGTVIKVEKVKELPKERAVLMSAILKVVGVVKAHEALSADEIQIQYEIGAPGIWRCPPFPELAVGDEGIFCLLYTKENGFLLFGDEDILQRKKK